MKYLLLPFILSIVYGLLLISSRIMKQKKSLSDDLIQSYLFLLAICTTITGAVVGGLAAIGWEKPKYLFNCRCRRIACSYSYFKGHNVS